MLLIFANHLHSSGVQYFSVFVGTLSLTVETAMSIVTASCIMFLSPLPVQNTDQHAPMRQLLQCFHGST